LITLSARPSWSLEVDDDLDLSRLPINNSQRQLHRSYIRDMGISGWIAITAMSLLLLNRASHQGSSEHKHETLVLNDLTLLLRPHRLRRPGTLLGHLGS